MFWNRHAKSNISPVTQPAKANPNEANTLPAKSNPNAAALPTKENPNAATPQPNNISSNIKKTQPAAVSPVEKKQQPAVVSPEEKKTPPAAVSPVEKKTPPAAVSPEEKKTQPAAVSPEEKKTQPAAVSPMTKTPQPAGMGPSTMMPQMTGYSPDMMMPQQTYFSPDTMMQQPYGSSPGMFAPQSAGSIPYSVMPGKNPCPLMQYDPAIARISGGPDYPQIAGVVTFRTVAGWTEVCVDIAGLPPYRPAMDGRQQIGPHGFHIHMVGNCTVGNPANPFEAAGGHWNPTNQPHGNHAGDFPALFSNDGRARMCFYTNKFRADDVIGKSIIIHENPDDYRTQPSGNSGRKIACGVITRMQ